MEGADAFNDLDLRWVERDLTEAQNQNALDAALEAEAMIGDAAVATEGEDLNAELAQAAPVQPNNKRKGRGRPLSGPAKRRRAPAQLIQQNLAAALLEAEAEAEAEAAIPAIPPLKISTVGRRRHSCTTCKAAKTKCSFGRLEADDPALHEPCTYCANNGRKCIVA